jgi:hypothetical protein
MKKTALTMLLTGLGTCVFAQGQFALNNILNTSVDPFATSNGLFWLSTGGAPALINQDFNAAFYAGTDPSSLTLIAAFLLSDGSAINDNAFGAGTFIEVPLKVHKIPGAFISAFFQIQAWTGNFDTYAAAISGGAPAAQSPVFVNPLNIPPGATTGLDQMPAMVLSVVPEPSVISLLALGGTAICLLRSRSGTGRSTNREKVGQRRT